MVWFDLGIRVRPRFFDQVESGNKHFSLNHVHTYQNYEQRRQKIGTILGNKEPYFRK